MGQIFLTSQDRVRGLERIGYSQREAQFLELAALHGGYFLRRQYATFLGQTDGGSITQLIEKAVLKNHVRILTFYHKTNIYHLCARPLYAVLGQADNRNRRERQPFTIKNKLMGLDFVLAHRDRQYLSTEQEKLNFFTGVLGVATSLLPTKLYQSRHQTAQNTARYFVDKFPMCSDTGLVSGSSPVVSFCFVDEGQITLSRFESYLKEYAQLWRTLAEFHVIYVAASAAHFEAAKRMFTAFLASEQCAEGRLSADPIVTRLLAHFEMRRLYEAKQFTEFDRTKLIRFRNEREEFSGPEHEAHYAQWMSGQGEPTSATLIAKAPRQPMNGSFAAYLLEHSYELFGSLAG